MHDERHFIIGTAGHIDHGKTSLVQALTRINTDRLKEEQERGMTIDLGYAFLDVAGQRVGIVDVPGHEKFVKNMLAGATGVDLALLVVAADDGVMPQTVEHFEILNLLGVDRGIVALTKIDLVDEELCALARDDVRALLQGTALEGAEIVDVSSVTGEGVEDLREKIGRLIEGAEVRRPGDLPFRMPIDRVFSQQGFGCIVTGSVIAGSAPKGATLTIVPGGAEVRIRGIQVHGEDSEQAAAGQRTALNLSGVKADGVERGYVLSEIGHLVLSELVDVDLRLLKTARGKLKHNTRVRFHVGTTEVMARVSVLQDDALAPGADGFAQLRLERPVPVQRGDRYVIRSYSPVRTIGGGRILRRQARRLKRNRAGVLRALERLAGNDAEVVVEQAIRDAGPFACTPEDMAHVTEMPIEIVCAAVDSLQEQGKILVGAGRLLSHAEELTAASERILATLKRSHDTNRLDTGMIPAQLISRARVSMPKEAVERVLAQMKEAQSIKEVDGLISLAGFEPRLRPEERAAAEKLERVFAEGGVTPPLVKEALASTAGDSGRGEELLDMLIHAGKIVRLPEGLCFHAEAIARIKEQVTAFLRTNERMGMGDLKDLLGISRKFAIPIAEHLDKIGVTQRVGDARVLRT